MKRARILGWIGVSITVLLSGFWAYWGAFENFHEGWYSKSFWNNILMFFFQYLLFAIFFIVLALVILKWKKIGLVLHLLAGAFCVWFFSGANFSVLWLMMVIPFAALGLLYYFGEPYPLRWAYRLIVCVPLVIVLAISIPQGIKVAKRIDDGDFGTRVVEGSGVSLAWAPRGPGWPDDGVTWEEAQEVCKYLSEDGRAFKSHLLLDGRYLGSGRGASLYHRLQRWCLCQKQNRPLRLSFIPRSKGRRRGRDNPVMYAEKTYFGIQNTKRSAVKRSALCCWVSSPGGKESFAGYFTFFERKVNKKTYFLSAFAISSAAIAIHIFHNRKI
jgi:hypothetical protein